MIVNIVDLIPLIIKINKGFKTRNKTKICNNIHLWNLLKILKLP